MRRMRSIAVTAKSVVLLSGLLFVLPVHPGQAAAGDPAVAQVQVLNDALLKSMRAGPGESMTERYRSLEPIIQQVFALPLVTRLASPGSRSALCGLRSARTSETILSVS